MYDEIIIKAFLDNQTRMYERPVAADYDEALDFLSEICAVVCDSLREAYEYLLDTGVDIEGLTENDILNLPEIIKAEDGRFLILEI